jgi:hypothetical protein
VVEKVLSYTRAAMAVEGSTLKDRGEWIVANLGTCMERMQDMRKMVLEEEEEEQVEDEENRGKAGKEFKSRLAGLAFDMARETKELVRTVEDIDNESRHVGTVDLS